MTPDGFFEEFTNSFQQRKFAAGLLVACIDFLEALETPNLALSSFDGFLNRFRRQTRTAQGARANTLIRNGYERVDSKSVIRRSGLRRSCERLKRRGRPRFSGGPPSERQLQLDRSGVRDSAHPVEPLEHGRGQGFVRAD